MSGGETLQTWLDRHREGLQPSPEDLCRLCMERVRALVKPRLASFPDVSRDAQTTEILDDTLLRLLKALPSVRPADVIELDRYLATVIRRVLLDRLKAIRSRERVLERFATLLPTMNDDDIADLDDMVRLHEYIDALPDEPRTFFDLLYYRGMSTADAAVKLSTSVSTVKRHWSRHRNDLAAHFGVWNPSNS